MKKEAIKRAFTCCWQHCDADFKGATVSLRVMMSQCYGRWFIQLSEEEQKRIKKRKNAQKPKEKQIKSALDLENARTLLSRGNINPNEIIEMSN